MLRKKEYPPSHVSHVIGTILDTRCWLTVPKKPSLRSISITDHSRTINRDTTVAEPARSRTNPGLLRVLKDHEGNKNTETGVRQQCHPQELIKTIHEPNPNIMMGEKAVAEHFRTLTSAIIFVNEDNQNISNEVRNHLQGWTNCDFTLDPRDKQDPDSGRGSIVLSKIDDSGEVLEKLEYKFSFYSIEKKEKSGLVLTINSIHNYEFDKDDTRVTSQKLNTSMKVFESKNLTPNIADKLMRHLISPSNNVVYLNDWRRSH